MSLVMVAALSPRLVLTSSKAEHIILGMRPHCDSASCVCAACSAVYGESKVPVATCTQRLVHCRRDTPYIALEGAIFVVFFAYFGLFFFYIGRAFRQLRAHNYR